MDTNRSTTMERPGHGAALRREVERLGAYAGDRDVVNFLDSIAEGEHHLVQMSNTVILSSSAVKTVCSWELPSRSKAARFKESADKYLEARKVASRAQGIVPLLGTTRPGAGLCLSASLRFVRRILALRSVRFFELHLDNSETLRRVHVTMMGLGCLVDADPEALRLRVRLPVG